MQFGEEKQQLARSVGQAADPSLACFARPETRPITVLYVEQAFQPHPSARNDAKLEVQQVSRILLCETSSCVENLEHKSTERFSAPCFYFPMRLLLACMMAVRKDCGLNRPLSQVTAGGSWGLPTQSASCVSLACPGQGREQIAQKTLMGGAMLGTVVRLLSLPVLHGCCSSLLLTDVV